MAKKQWFDVWVWRKEMLEPEKVARVKSVGLTVHIGNSLREVYDFAGSEEYVKNMMKRMLSEDR